MNCLYTKFLKEFGLSLICIYGILTITSLFGLIDSEIFRLASVHLLVIAMALFNEGMGLMIERECARNGVKKRVLFLKWMQELGLAYLIVTLMIVVNLISFSDFNQLPAHLVIVFIAFCAAYQSWTFKKADRYDQAEKEK